MQDMPSMSWGINRGILDRASYEPVVGRVWSALCSHITDAFLSAGSEVFEL